MARTEANVKIRPMEPEDISDILEIDRKISGVQRAFTYKGSFHGLIGGEMGMSLVVEMDDKVVGFVLAYLSYVREQVSEACMINIFGVDPKYRKQGIASMLFKKLLNECHSKKIGLVCVTLQDQDRELKNFFEHIGFERMQYVGYSKAL